MMIIDGIKEFRLQLKTKSSLYICKTKKSQNFISNSRTLLVEQTKNKQTKRKNHIWILIKTDICHLNYTKTLSLSRHGQIEVT